MTFYHMCHAYFSRIFLVLMTISSLWGPVAALGQSPDKATQAIEWLTLEEAEARVAEEPRPLFIDVYTDWCGWCKVMDRETFADPEVVAYVRDNYYAVKLDAESNEQLTVKGRTATEAELSNSFNVRAFPTIVLMKADLNTVRAKPGFAGSRDFLKMLRRWKD